MMQELPLFLKLQEKPCLLLGGAEAAYHKLRLLLSAGARVTLIAENPCHSVAQLIEDNRLSELNDRLIHLNRQASIEDLEAGRYFLIIDASGDSSLNRQVSSWAENHNQLLNVVDQSSLSNSHFAAIVDRFPMTLAISSSGKAPMLARLLKERLEMLLPPNYGQLASLVSSFRDKVKAALPDLNLRRRFWDEQLQGSIGEHLLKGDRINAEKQLERQLQGITANKQAIAEGEVFLVGGGPGNPDLLTIRAQRLMQQADLVLYDRLISQEVLDRVRSEATRIYIGKNRNNYGITQDNINRYLVDFAKQGLRVLRLKGGDPFIFGRGGEELTFLAEQKIPFQVVPGITAASGCAAYAGIPLTHREHAQSVRFITGHHKNDTLNLDWKELCMPGQTLVFYMGLNGLETICTQLLKHGIRTDIPAALVEKGTLPDQRVFVSTLKELPVMVREADAEPPTLIIVGDVVQYQNRFNWYSAGKPQ